MFRYVVPNFTQIRQENLENTEIKTIAPLSTPFTTLIFTKLTIAHYFSLCIPRRI